MHHKSTIKKYILKIEEKEDKLAVMEFLEKNRKKNNNTLDNYSPAYRIFIENDGISKLRKEINEMYSKITISK